MTKETLIYSDALGNQEINTISFIQQGIVTFNGNQYCSFVDSSGNLMVAKRTLPDSEWSVVDTGFNTNATDLHNNSSIGIDNNGFIHISWSQHGGILNYAISDDEEDITTFSVATMVGTEEDSVTYPRFFKTESNFFFAYRQGDSALGSEYLNKYSITTQTWSRVSLLIEGETIGTDTLAAYCDNFSVDIFGRVHVTAMFRYNVGAEWTSRNYFHMYSDDECQTWKKDDGTAQTIPAMYGNVSSIFIPHSTRK